MLSACDRVRGRRFGIPVGEIAWVSETEVNVESQATTITFMVFRQAPDGQWDCFREEHRNRCFFRPDLARWLDGAGRVPYSWMVESAHAPVTMETWHLHAVCRKEGSPG